MTTDTSYTLAFEKICPELRVSFSICGYDRVMILYKNPSKKHHMELLNPSNPENMKLPDPSRSDKFLNFYEGSESLVHSHTARMVWNILVANGWKVAT